MQKIQQSGQCHYIFKTVEFTRLTFHNFTKLYVNLFYSDQYPDSEALIKSLEGIASFYEQPVYTLINVEKNPDLLKQFAVQKVPTIVLSDSNKQIIKEISPDSINDLIIELDDILKVFEANFENERIRMFSQIEKILNIHPVMIFIKGTPENPKCGFSSSLLEILKKYELNFGYFNILENENVRNWIRHYSKWNTYPQLYFNQKLVGGIDKVKELIAQNKFEELIPVEAMKSDTNLKLERLLALFKEKVLIFFEGTPYSADENKKLSNLIKESGVKFNFFNLNDDNDFKFFFLQKFSIKELPIIFINGSLIGGTKEITEIIKTKKILEMVHVNEWSLNAKQKLDYLLGKYNLMVFVEGNFDDIDEKTKEVFKILKKQEFDFQYFNVLFDSEIKNLVIQKNGIDSFPQIIWKGGLIGGYEKIEEIEKNGKIKETFA